MCFFLQIDQLIASTRSSGVIRHYARSWENYRFRDWNTQINFHLIKSRHGLLAQCLQPKEAEVWKWKLGHFKWRILLKLKTCHRFSKPIKCRWKRLSHSEDSAGSSHCSLPSLSSSPKHTQSCCFWAYTYMGHAIITCLTVTFLSHCPALHFGNKTSTHQGT